MDRFFQKHDFMPAEAPGWAGIWPRSVNHMRVIGRRSPWSVPHYCFQLVLSDGVRFFARDAADEVLDAGAVFLIEPETPFCYHAVDEGLMQIYALRLAGPLAGEFLGSMGLTHRRPWGLAKSPQAVYRTLEILMRLAQRRDAEAGHLAVSVLHRLPAQVGLRPETRLSAGDLVSRVMDHLDNHLDRGENIDELARRFGVSRHTLFGKFKERFGVSPVRIIIRKRLERAKYLLRTTAYEIRDVARFSGYASVEHFQRQFRRQEGITPGVWRTEAQVQGPEEPPAEFEASSRNSRRRGSSGPPSSAGSLQSRIQ